MSKHTPFDRRIVLDWLQWGKFPEGNNAPQIALDYIGELERKLAEKDAENERLMAIKLDEQTKDEFYQLARNLETENGDIRDQWFLEIKTKDAIIEKLKEQVDYHLRMSSSGNYETYQITKAIYDKELAELEEKGDKV